MKVSLIMIVKDEEENIEECLDSVKWVDDIVIIDANSSDKTVERCLRFTDRVYKRDWDDDYASQRNYALGLAKNDWVLTIDADERVSKELKEEIESLANSSDYNAYHIPIREFYFGRWLRHGGYYPGYKIRLFKKSNACYRGRIHETLEIENGINAGYLKGHIVHNMVVSYSKKLKKSDYYSTLMAEEKIAEIKRGSVKWRRLNLLYEPLRTFLIGYLFLKGFLDGWPGLICHAHNAFGQFAINVKIYERLMGV